MHFRAFEPSALLVERLSCIVSVKLITEIEITIQLSLELTHAGVELIAVSVFTLIFFPTSNFQEM